MSIKKNQQSQETASSKEKKFAENHPITLLVIGAVIATLVPTLVNFIISYITKIPFGQLRLSNLWIGILTILISTIILVGAFIGGMYFGMYLFITAIFSMFRNLGSVGEIVEHRRRRAVIAKLRQSYVNSHTNISPGIADGTELLPEAWVETELEKMGETWKQDKYI